MKCLIAIGLCLILIGCINTAKPTTYDYGNFSISQPAGWTQKENAGLYSFTPSVNSSERITFFQATVPKNMTNELQTIVELGLTNLHERLQDLTVTSKAKPTMLGNLNGIEVRFTATVDPDKMTYTQIFAKPKNIIYTFTYTCKSDSCNHYNEFYAMAKSIVVKN